MKRLVIALLVFVPALASAQVSPYPLGVSAPIFGLPASAVSGGGGFTGQLFGPNSCALPAYSFTASPSTGLGSDTANAWCLSANGVAILRGSSTAVTSTVPLLLPDGTAAAPALSFASQTTKGLYSPSNNLVGMAIAGVEVVEFRPGTGTGLVADDGDISFRNLAEIHWMGSSNLAGSSRAISMDSADRFRFDAGPNYFTGYSLITAANTGVMMNGSGITKFLGGSATNYGQVSHDGTDASLLAVGASDLRLGVGGVAQWRLAASAGNLIPLTSEATDIGLTGTRVRAVYAGTVGRVTAQSAANASIATVTVGAADGSFEVSANMNVTGSTTLITTLTCTYTDESNTARTMILPVTQLSGSFIAGGAITGTGAWETPVMRIRAKAATAITILTSAGTFTGVTYTAEGFIVQK